MFIYVGMTEDIENRLAKHNAGQVPHTSKFAPWTIDAAIAVRDKTTAAQLERYLKSGSGRAFANKHLFATSSVKTAKGVKQRWGWGQAPASPHREEPRTEGELSRARRAGLLSPRRHSSHSCVNRHTDARSASSSAFSACVCSSRHSGETRPSNLFPFPITGTRLQQ